MLAIAALVFGASSCDGPTPPPPTTANVYTSMSFPLLGAAACTGTVARKAYVPVQLTGSGGISNPVTHTGSVNSVPTGSNCTATDSASSLRVGTWRLREAAPSARLSFNVGAINDLCGHTHKQRCVETGCACTKHVRVADRQSI